MEDLRLLRKENLDNLRNVMKEMSLEVNMMLKIKLKLMFIVNRWIVRLMSSIKSGRWH